MAVVFPMESLGTVVVWLLPRAALADASPCVCDSGRPQACRVLPAAHSLGPANLMLSQGWREAESSHGELPVG